MKAKPPFLGQVSIGSERNRLFPYVERATPTTLLPPLPYKRGVGPTKEGRKQHEIQII